MALRAIARILLNVLRLILLPLWLLGRIFGRPRGTWVHIRLRPRLSELDPALPPLARFLPEFGRALPTSLAALRRLGRHLVRDSRIRGVVLEVPPLLAGWAECAALRDLVQELRGAGLRTAAFLPQGGGNKEMYVASAAERVVLGPRSTLLALGVSLETRYLKVLLDKIGVNFQTAAQGEYKTAMETFSRDSMSEPQREQLTALLRTVDRELISAVSERPDFNEAKARALFDGALIRAKEAVGRGFADALAYDDDLPLVLAEPGEKPPTLARASQYYAFKESRPFLRLAPRPYVAVVEIHGPIVSESVGFGRKRADPGHVASALRAARADRFAVGVVLHVNSPGGSALASDRIHREICRLAEKKPVVACLGNVAASGGYYVAAAAQAVVAQPTTITGSIGVVASKLVASEMLDHLGVRTEIIRASPHADMFSVSRPLSEEERSILDRETGAFYDDFKSVVAEGRGKTPEEVEELARGRVWSGQDALGHGLVDRLGGLPEAVEEVLSRAGIKDRPGSPLEVRRVRPRRVELPPPEPSTATAHILSQLAPEAAALLGLAAGPDRVLYFAQTPVIN